MINHLNPLLFLLSLFMLIARAQSNKFDDCKPTSYPCGHDCNISYPFRTPTMPDYCGHPGFEVRCKTDTTSRPMVAVNFSGDEYKVGSIDYESRVVNLVNPDALGDYCPRSFRNTTIDPSLFSYADYDVNMTLYFNCSLLDHITPNGIRNVSCPGSTKYGMHSYYSLPSADPLPPAELPKGCGSVVGIPMYGDDAAPLGKGRLDFLGVLQNGFDLNWLVGEGWCKGCQDSGGACGRGPAGPACFCPDGSATGDKCGTLCVDFPLLVFLQWLSAQDPFPYHAIC